MSMVRVRNAVLLAVMGLYLTLNYGFMQLRVPPSAGTGVPVGEVVLILALLTMNHIRVISRLQATVFVFPFFLWWSVSIGHALANVSSQGIWALRDATHAIESLFLLVGFGFATRPEHLERFFHWLPRLLVAGTLYALTYPFAYELQGYSPTIVSGAGHEVDIFFNYTTTSVLLLLAASWLMLFKERSRMTIAIEVFLVGYAVFLFQARTIYLQVFAIFLFFFFFRRQALGKGVLGILLIVLALLALPLVGLQLQGRLDQQVSLDFIINHILSIGGVESEGLRGTARGVDLRLKWWTQVIGDWSASFDNLTIGLGFGFPLTDHVSLDGAIVREPHNSYLSVLARTGLAGAFALLWVHALLLGTWKRTYRTCVRIGWREGQNRLLVLMVFFILVWVYAMGEDAFEKPYFAISYYFFWGIVLKMAWALRREERAAGAEQAARRGASRRPAAAPGAFARTPGAGGPATTPPALP